jgi:hypothetical protein
MRTTTTATTIEENKGDNDPFDSYVKGRLESACWRGDLELVKTLLSEPSSSSALSEDFRTTYFTSLVVEPSKEMT